MNPSSKKRKDIQDFFLPVAKRLSSPNNKRSPHQHVNFDIPCSHPAAQQTAVPSLSLHPNFITTDEEQCILTFLNDPSLCTWRTDLSRRTMHFGGTYCLMPSESEMDTQGTPQVLQAPSMPEELNWLIQRMVDAKVYRDNQRPQFCIVNEYKENLGISAHTENFQFEEPVVGLSLLSACPIRFHELTKPYDGSVRSGKAGKAEKTGRREDILMPGRSLLVMRGESRWKWQHEILRSAKGRSPMWKRVSLTFRYKPDNKEV